MSELKEENPINDLFEEIEEVCKKHSKDISDNGYHGDVKVKFKKNGQNYEHLVVMWEKKSKLD